MLFGCEALERRKVEESVCRCCMMREERSSVWERCAHYIVQKSLQKDLQFAYFQANPNSKVVYLDGDMEPRDSEGEVRLV